MMRPTWILLLLGQMVLGHHTMNLCARGFRKVLNSGGCEYFAYGPHFMSSYCQWNQQLEYGLTTNFCCGGICAYCFQEISRITDDTTTAIDFETTTASGTDYPWTSPPDGFSEISTEERSLGELISRKIDHMINMLRTDQTAQSTTTIDNN